MNVKRFLKVLVVALAVGLPMVAQAQTTKEGLEYLERGQPEKAYAVFSGVVQREPTAQNYYYLGSYYLRENKADSARMVLDKAAAADPKSPFTFLGQGELAMSQGQVDAAGKAFNQAVKASKSRNAEVFYRMGRAYLDYQTKDLKAARSALQKAIDLDNKNPTYFTTLGKYYMLSTDASNAARNYEQALYFDPKYARAHAGQGEIFYLAKQYTEAAAKYQDAVNADPTFLPAHLALAEIYFLARQYDKASEAYAGYLKQRPQPTPDELFRYAGYLYLNKNFTESNVALRQLPADYPNPVMYRLLAYNSLETKDYSAGLDAMQNYMSRAKQEDILISDHESFARLNLLAGRDTMAAIASMRKVIEADSSKQNMHREIATLLLMGRKYDLVAEEYRTMEQKGIKLGGNDYFNLGRAFYLAQQFPKADSAFAKVTEVASNSNLGWLWRARTNAKLDPESTEGLAKPYYEKYVEITTDATKYQRELVEANFYLGYYNYLQKNKEDAKKYLDAVIALDPAHENAKTVLEALATL